MNDQNPNPTTPKVKPPSKRRRRLKWPKSKFTPEIAAAICARLARGHYPETAAAAEGIGRSTFYARRQQFPEFAAQVEQAMALAQDRLLAGIEAGGKDWARLAWI